jgi:hypothetical protein
MASNDEAVQFKTAPDVMKKVHVIPVTVTAPNQPGEFIYTLTIDTDLAGASRALCPIRGAVRGDSPTAATRNRPDNLPVR